MNRDEQYKFVGDVLNGLEREIFEKIQNGKIPEDWDGYELRQYLVDKLAERFNMGCKMTRKRMTEYKNTVIVNNL